ERYLISAMTFLDGLNDRQREAAETLAGPLLIVAGAGSGKTRALTYRIANLIKEGVAQPWQILAVTFTNKAAGEMKNRVNHLLNEEFDLDSDRNRPMIGTFHSICVRILRRHFDRFGRDKSFVIYDTVDQEGIMKRLIKEKQIDDDRIKPRMVLSVISSAKNQLRSAERFGARATRSSEQLIADLYTGYEKRMKENNALDFDDLLLYVVRLFKEHPDVLDEYQERWRFVNIDEYQDTNHAQYVLIKLLADKYRNLCVIGDSDQSIYGFRGADIKNILDFEKDYSEAKLVKLEQNYRSTQPILDAADAIIEKNKQRKSKKMWTENKEGDLIEVWRAENEYNEAEKAAQEIENLKADGVSLKDVVILYRTNAQSRVMEEILLRYGLPYKVIGGVKFYARREVKDILAYLRVVLNINDTDSLLRVINVPSRKIGQTTVNKLQAFGVQRSLNLAEVLKHVEMISEINEGTKKRLSDFWHLVEKWKKSSETMVVSDLIREITRDINYKTHLLDGTEEGEMRHENILELTSVATKYDGLEPEVSLASFLEEVALVADTDNIDENLDALTMMTLHSVKGLEYPYVFILGCEENIFPHSRSIFDPQELEEERRLMYVGVTRAMKKLYLLAAKQRTMFGDFQRNTMSRFISDIPNHLVSRIGGGDSFVAPASPSDFGETFEERKVHLTAEDKFKDGDKIRHVTFGDGMVVERRGDLVTVAFSNPLYGVKKFAANIAPIEKITN
ncbi:UvrD-helicase domain-containing protein, partial [Candidatus Pacearchaeota archaeon]|nr:UvrD-helicase domain-containing protein [Candidatus Pacearchaeota archaeon]